MNVVELFDVVRPIVDEVSTRGDEALRDYALRFDHVSLDRLDVSPEEWAEAENLIDEELKTAVRRAYRQIESFHAAQKFAGVKVQTAPGVWCGQRALPISRVGLYIPGGTAPLFSTVLMLGIPARIAGCRQVVLCTPPCKDGRVHPAVLFAASLCGISQVYKVGGAGAIAAMAKGSATIPKVDKIFGPGNQYVTAAKQWVSLQGTAIDMPAGPSEVAVLADDTARPDFVAADLLSQAEHGADSQSLLITTSQDLANEVMKEIERQLAQLPRREIAARALLHSKVIVLKTMEEALEMTNAYAPEHLIIATHNYRQIANQIRHAGSVFLGNYSCESAGDYASGTNHTLPTSGFARSYSGLCLDSFQRKMTLQEITPEGVMCIGETVEQMAECEGLQAHARAMSLRREVCESQKVEKNFNSVEHLVRPNVLEMEAYSSARNEYEGGSATVFLDANESPFNAPINRYPDPLQQQLKKKVGQMKGVGEKQLFLGNGSDEAIDLVFRVFCRSGVDNVVALEPTYGMYAVCAATNEVEYRRVPLEADYSFRAAAVMKVVDANTKAVFLCSPNNPTGNLLPREEIENLLRKFQGVVVVDEAYIDFAPEASVVSLLGVYPRLLVLSTFSKAWASAGLRLGIAMASEEIISYFNKVKYPYNIDVLTQQKAMEMLERKGEVEVWINQIIAERVRMTEVLSAMPACLKVFPSDANFLLAKFKNATRLYELLVDRGIVVRNRSRIAQCEDCLRITIGTQEENNALIREMKRIMEENQR